MRLMHPRWSLPLPLRLLPTARYSSCRSAATLAGVGLVNEDGEAPAPMFIANLVENEGKFLHRGDNNLLAACEELRRSPECSAWPTMAATWANCLMVSRICLSSTRRSVTTMTESKMLACPAPVQRAGVRARQSSCSCRYLPNAESGSVALSRVNVRRSGASAPRRVDDSAGRSAAFSCDRYVVFLLDDLGVVFDDVSQFLAGKDFTPQVIGLKAVRVGRVAQRHRSSLVEGRNHDSLPLRWVQKRTSWSSTAKCTRQRPN